MIDKVASDTHATVAKSKKLFIKPSLLSLIMATLSCATFDIND